MKKNGFVFLLTIAVLLPMLPAVSGAAATVTIDVMTVLASNESDHIDPALAELAKELKSVFRYSSYDLIGRKKGHDNHHYITCNDQEIDRPALDDPPNSNEDGQSNGNRDR